MLKAACYIREEKKYRECSIRQVTSFFARKTKTTSQARIKPEPDPKSLARLTTLLCYTVVFAQTLGGENLREKERRQLLSSELPHLHKAGALWKPHFTKVFFIHNCSAKSVEASSVLSGGLVPRCQGFRWLNKAFPGVNVAAVSSKGADVLPPWECKWEGLNLEKNSLI